MNLRDIPRPGPGQFICVPGCLHLLEEKLKRFRLPVIISGQKSYRAFVRHYPGKVPYPLLRYDGSCSHENIRAIAERIPAPCDCILAIGGGKVLDTAKAVAAQLNIDYVTIPTQLGTCAAYTPLSVIYYPDHRIKGGEHYERAAYLCLADLNLLVHSPKEYLLGGIGDSLAKWYEADAAIRQMQTPPTALTAAGLEIAAQIRNLLLEYSGQAIAAIEAQRLNQGFEYCAQAILGLGGMVGGLSGRTARVAGAHAIHDAMSQLAETHVYQHGVKVAYGILVQLAAEENYAEIERLLPYFARHGFPRRLADLSVNFEKEQKMALIAAIAASEKQSFRLALPRCSPELILKAIKYLEQLD
ncbi:putative oxidoreductase [Mesocricetibacter intestinalis]|uniref:Putative oxidoreductase n=2 Tax=Mesocricetibacter intestinalis TaxID=1521930 RepID=A0A4R6VAU5_9PAST|nr:putative oxidoreductase [Mesocricetibacter intestinalis]